MTPTPDMKARLWEAAADLLDIPESYYEKAADRYTSIGEWLHRPESLVARFDPEVYPQGSFRYGTVNRPLAASEEYDLDTAVEMKVAKDRATQKQLKHLL